MKILKQENKKAHRNDRLFCVDRGGVEPLEQSGNSAPETARTRPSCPQTIYYQLSEKRKAPLRELFGVTNDLVRSRITTLGASIANPYFLSTSLWITINQ